MANEPKVPDVRDDDAEEVADKLSIAAAMWARGDRADALTWLRRAAESAADAEQDMRALELAKAASELSSLASAAPASAAPEPAAPEPARPEAPATPAATPSLRPKPSLPPRASAMPPGKAPAAAASVAKKAAPASRPGASKLPPLPPMRPLGTPATAAPKPARVPSMITSATGAASASGTVARDGTPAPPEPGKPMPWDDQRAPDDEPTQQMELEPDPSDLDETSTREVAAVPAQPAREEARASAPASQPLAARELPLAVGVRVRVLVAADGVHIVPEGESREGIAAVVVPLDPDDDLRALFQRRA